MKKEFFVPYFQKEPVKKKNNVAQCGGPVGFKHNLTVANLVMVSSLITEAIKLTLRRFSV